MFFAFSRFMVLWRRIQKLFVLNDLIYKIFFFRWKERVQMQCMTLLFYPIKFIFSYKYRHVSLKTPHF